MTEQNEMACPDGHPAMQISPGLIVCHNGDTFSYHENDLESDYKELLRKFLAVWLDNQKLRAALEAARPMVDMFSDFPGDTMVATVLAQIDAALGKEVSTANKDDRPRE